MALRRYRLGTAVAALGLATLLLTACAPEPTPAAEPGETNSSATTSKTSDPESSSSQADSASTESSPTEQNFDRTAHSLDDPMSIWVVSNKLRALQPADFAPTDLVMPAGVENEFEQPLRAPAASAVESLASAAQADGIDVRIISAYRDYATQTTLYDSYVARDGQQAADTYSARPGHSEHQTGLVVDFDDHGDCYLAACFGETPAGTWLAAHASEYGFIVRYPDGKQAVTGFMPEPWHFRFVGVDLAERMRADNVTTLEEFFDLPDAPGYAQ